LSTSTSVVVAPGIAETAKRARKEIIDPFPDSLVTV
jgi:hypothetical protein